MAERVPNGQPRLLSVSEVSHRTGLAVSTVRHKIADGTLPALKLGPNRHSAVRVDEAELERWIYGWDETGGMGAEPLKLLNPQEALQLEQYARTATVSWAMEGPCSEQPARWCSAADCCQTPKASLLRRLLNRGAR